MKIYSLSSLKIPVFLCTLVYSSFLAAQSADNPDSVGSVENSVRHQIEQTVQHKLGFYAERFQNVNFVLLDSSGDVARNMAALKKILGQDPTPLDYEHTESLRQDLLMVSLMRIELLLSTDVGSATMFKPGKQALARRKYVCVVTMDPVFIAKDDRAATRNLLTLSDKEFNSVPRENYLNHLSYLKFSLDHEIYHCLDTLINGGIPMSHLKHWGDYNMLREESAADTYGLLMHVAQQDSQDSFGRLIEQIRGLSLLSSDINHYTYRSIGLALKQDPEKLSSQDINHLRSLADQISKKAVVSYEGYLRYAQAACKAVKQLGGQCVVNDYRPQAVDEGLVRALIRDTRDSYRALVGHELHIRQ